MADRLYLHTLLEDILGSKEVYFQPPESTKITYPAIVYSKEPIKSTFANNSVYKQDDAYNIVVIYDDPDSDIPRKLSLLPMCRHDRHYVSDNLYHDAFIKYI